MPESSDPTRLIFLHIPKTAGTSFRELLQDNYGSENVYWHGLQESTKNSRMSSFPVVGGHMPYKRYQRLRSRKLFIAAVRDPVARAISLFHYHCRKDRASYQEWIRLGLDPSDMLKTIRESRQFRKEIHNAQCAYLAPSGTFQSVMETIGKEEFVLGCQEHFETMTNFLAAQLGWREQSCGVSNASLADPNAVAHLKNNRELVECIRDLGNEDMKLHEYLLSRKLLVSIRKDKAPIRFVPVKGPAFPSKSARAKVKVRLADSAPLKMQVNELSEVNFLISNQSEDLMPSGGKHPVRLAYHWIDDSGAPYLWEGLRTALTQDIPPGGRQTLAARVAAPDRAGNFTLIASLILEGIAWFDTNSADHCAAVSTSVSNAGDSGAANATYPAQENGTSNNVAAKHGEISRQEAVGIMEMLYRKYLGRGPDPKGLAYWSNILTTGERSPSEIEAIFDRKRQSES